MPVRVLYLASPTKRQLAIPPHQVWFYRHFPAKVQLQALAAGAPTGAESSFRDSQGFTQGLRQEFLEHNIHIHNKCGGAHSAPARLVGTMAQYKTGKFHDGPVVFIQAVKRDRGNPGWRDMAQRNFIQHSSQQLQPPAGFGGAKAHPAQPMGRGLHQPVGEYVGSELIVLHLHRQWGVVPSPELLVKIDASPDGLQGFLLQPLACRNASSVMEGEFKGLSTSLGLIDSPLDCRVDPGAPALEPEMTPHFPVHVFIGSQESVRINPARQGHQLLVGILSDWQTGINSRRWAPWGRR